MSRRGFVIFVVFLVIVAMAAGLTSVLAGVRGQSGVVRSLVERHEARLAARSSVLAIAATLQDERDRVLAGEIPSISESEAVIRYEEDPGWEWSLKEREGEAALATYSARLDINHADDALIDRFFDLLDSEENSAQRPTGELRTLGMIENAVSGETAQHLTVMSIDPPERSGAGGQIGEVGEARLTPGGGGREPIGLSRESLGLVSRIANESTNIDSRASLLRAIRNMPIPEEDWSVLLDLFDFREGEPETGLIDLSEASAQVLSALPGLDMETAEQLVERREQLDESTLAGLAWPVTEGLIEGVVYEGMIDLLTTRSMQLGVTFSTQRAESDVPSASLEVLEPVDTFSPQITLEMIVDLSGERPRIAYLRDVTYLAVLEQEPEVETEDLIEDDPADGSELAESVTRRARERGGPETPNRDVASPQEETGSASTAAWGRFVPEGAPS